jgi:hypothetical protein
MKKKGMVNFFCKREKKKLLSATNRSSIIITRRFKRNNKFGYQYTLYTLPKKYRRLSHTITWYLRSFIFFIKILISKSRKSKNLYIYVIIKNNLYKKDKITPKILAFFSKSKPTAQLFLLGVSIFIVHKKIKITLYKSLLTNLWKKSNPLKKIKSLSKPGQMKFSSKNKSVILLSQWTVFYVSMCTANSIVFIFCIIIKINKTKSYRSITKKPE